MGKRRSLVLFGAIAIASATLAFAADKARVSWDQVGDPALREALHELVGTDAVDCGFVDLRKHKPASTVKSAALKCVADAEHRRVPFKFGVARLPMGSTAYEVYARSTDGQSWLLGHGLRPMDNTLQSSMERCMVVEVSPRTLFISGMDCSQFKLLSSRSP